MCVGKIIENLQILEGRLEDQIMESPSISVCVNFEHYQQECINNLRGIIETQKDIILLQRKIMEENNNEKIN